MSSRLILSSAVSILLATSATLVLAQNPDGAVQASIDSARDTLKAAGVEPTADGVRQFLESALDPQRDREIDRLIEQLAAQEFTVRERSTRRLRAMPLVPAAKLEEAGQSEDREQALRAKMILTEIRQAKQSPLLAALRLIEQQRLDVEFALLLRLLERADRGATGEALLRAMSAVIGPEDRESAEGLIEHKELAMRNFGRRLLAKLDHPGETPLLEGVFDAVFVRIGSVSGGGSNLIAGWEFLPKSDLKVTHLGFLDHGANGLNAPHEVAIWRIDRRDKPVAMAKVPAGEEAELSGVFRYVPVEPVVLQAGESYAVVAQYPSPKDSQVSMVNPSNLIVKFSDHFSVVGRRYAFPHEAMAYPTHLQEGEKHASLGPSFRYEATPESK